MSLDVMLHIDDEEVYTANITHNLNEMAEAAGIYKHLWRPEEIGITKAVELIEPIKAGLADMVDRPSYYEQYNPANGWGSYKNFVPWIAKYLEACKRYPDAVVSVCR